jgi:hypothetical protein
MAPLRRGGKSISVFGDRGDNAITKNEKKKNVTRFRFLDGWWRKSGSNCLKTEEEPHKLIVAFNLPTRHAIGQVRLI